MNPIKFKISEAMIMHNTSTPVPMNALRVFGCLGGLKTSPFICFQEFSSIIKSFTTLNLFKSLFTVLAKIKKMPKDNTNIKKLERINPNHL